MQYFNKIVTLLGYIAAINYMPLGGINFGVC